MAQLAEISARFRLGDWVSALRWVWLQLKWLGKSFGKLGWLVVLAALVFVPLSVARWWRKSRSTRSSQRVPIDKAEKVSGGLADLLSQLDQVWARKGARRAASRAPLEHLNAVPPEKISPQLREASGKVVECFYRAVFGGVPIQESEIQELRQALDRASSR